MQMWLLVALVGRHGSPCLVAQLVSLDIVKLQWGMGTFSFRGLACILIFGIILLVPLKPLSFFLLQLFLKNISLLHPCVLCTSAG